MTLEKTIRKHGVDYVLLGETHGKTHKELGVEEIPQDADKNGIDTIVAVTSGNYGLAIAKAVAKYNREYGKNLKVAFIVDSNLRFIEDFERAVNNEIGSSNYRIVGNDSMRDIWLDVKDREKIVKKDPVKAWILNDFVGPVSEGYQERWCGKVKDYTNFIPQAYYDHAEEILRKNLDYLVLPIGSGKLFVSFYRKLKELQNNGENIKTKLVGIVPKENPIYHKYINEENEISGEFKGSSLADKLVTPGMNEEIYHDIRDAISEDHIIKEITEKQIKRANRRFAKENLEYSASVSGSVFEKKLIKELGIEKEAKVGLYRTGSGIYTKTEYELNRIRKKKISRNLRTGTAIGLSTLLFFYLLHLIDPYIKEREAKEAAAYRQQETQLLQSFPEFDFNRDNDLDRHEHIEIYYTFRKHIIEGKRYFNIERRHRDLDSSHWIMLEGDKKLQINKLQYIYEYLRKMSEEERTDFIKKFNNGMEKKYNKRRK